MTRRSEKKSTGRASGLFSGRRLAAAAAAVVVLGGGTTAALVLPDSSTPFNFQTAFANAQAGDTIVVPDGSYPSVSLGGPAKAAAVTFQAANPGQAKVASLSVNVDNVHFVGIIAAGSGESRGSLSVCSTACAAKFADVVFDGFQGKSAFLRGSGITVIRSEFGNANGCKNLGIEDAIRFWAGGGSPSPDNDSLIDSEIHDWSGGSNGTCDGTVSPTPHLDCMQNQGGTNMLIRGNNFHGCPSNNIQMNPFGTGNVIGNVVVDANYLGKTGCCNSIALGTQSADTSVCPSLAITGNHYFSTPNLNSCANKGVVISGNTLCSSTAQAGCAIPAPLPPPPATTAATTEPAPTIAPTTTTEPPTTTEPVTTTNPVTTTEPPPTTTAPPLMYAPVCEPTCDEQIVALNAQLGVVNAQLAAAQTSLEAAHAAGAALQAKLDKILEVLNAP